MAAILGASDEAVENLCKEVKCGFAVPVNYNCPGQVVVTGDKVGICNLQELAKDIGIKKIRVLNTSGPFHTCKLEESSNALRRELEKVKFHNFESTVKKYRWRTLYL